jgi:Flp pilus assembly protein TadB
VSPLVVLLAAVSAGLALAGIAGVVVPPRSRLAGRVRPYTLVTRAELGRSADAFTVHGVSDPTDRSTLGRLFGPPVRAGLRKLGRLVDRHDDAGLALRLRQAGWYDVTPDEHRMRAAGRAVVFASAGLVLGVALLHSAPLGFLLGFCGAVHGISRARAKLSGAVEARRERLRLELYTVNQLLAMHLRTGAGPVQATQRIVDRGRGAVVEELDAVLAAVRSGMSEGDAFRRAAETTPEPAATRTYRLFAAGAERGVDLAGGLRALSEDLRDARRDEMRKTATKRRAAMLVPTIAVLAPIMLLFVAAPLPSIVFGHH